MTLVSRAESIVERLRSFETTKNLAKEAEAFRTRAEQLRNAVAELRSLQNLQAGMAAGGISVVTDGSSRNTLTALALKLSNAFAEDRKSIVNIQLERLFLTPLNSFCARNPCRPFGSLALPR